jgi:hypothetical protein
VLEKNLNGPMLTREDSFIADRIAEKVRPAFAAAALDYRGLVRLDLDGTP